MTCTYKFIALGQRGSVVTVKRRYHVQTGGKLAALLLAGAELQRIWNETDGDPEKVLAPIRTALAENGFSDVLILPSSAELVEFRSDDRPPFESNDSSIEKFYADALRSLMNCAGAYFNANDLTKKACGEQLQTKLAELEMLTWER